MPRSLVRYAQIRRLGTPNVQESDSAYAEGRYFEANCLSTDLINHFVRVVGNTLGVPDVTKADPTDPLKMPAVGVIVQKPTTTTCLVQVSGQILSFSPVVAGTWYYVGLAGLPVTSPPVFPGIPQVIGVGLDTARLLLRPGFGTEQAAISAVDSEVPTGTIDGANVVFGTALPFKPGTTKFYHNGVRQRPGGSFDYFEGPGLQTLTMTLAPKVGDSLLVDYAV
jgi:hypothetical protein